MKKTQTSQPLTPHVVVEFDKLQKTTDLYNQVVEDRLNYIFHTVFEYCEAQLQTWWIDGAAEGEVGNINKLFDNDRIWFSNLRTEARKVHAEKFLANLDGETWYLLDAIPKQWLFEDFEDELVKGLELYRNQLKKQKTISCRKTKSQQTTQRRID